MATIKKNAKATAAKPTRSTRPESERELSGDDIALRAYLLFIERGGEHGHDLEDWLAAERQLSGQA